MIFLYMAAAVGIGIYDIRYLKQKRYRKEMVVYLCCMALASAIGIAYLLNPNQESIAGYLFEILNAKG